MQRWISACTGLRNSSTGVPMVTMTGPVRLISFGEDVKMSRRLSNAFANSGAAPCSINGNFPELSSASAASLMSLTLTVRPASARASTSGMPTWPAPPTTVRSAVLTPAGTDGALLADVMFKRSTCVRFEAPF